MLRTWRRGVVPALVAAHGTLRGRPPVAGTWFVMTAAARRAVVMGGPALRAAVRAVRRPWHAEPCRRPGHAGPAGRRTPVWVGEPGRVRGRARNDPGPGSDAVQGSGARTALAGRRRRGRGLAGALPVVGRHQGGGGAGDSTCQPRRRRESSHACGRSQHLRVDPSLGTGRRGAELGQLMQQHLAGLTRRYVDAQALDGVLAGHRGTCRVGQAVGAAGAVGAVGRGPKARPLCGWIGCPGCAGWIGRTCSCLPERWP